jgi:hypothetical protein
MLFAALRSMEMYWRDRLKVRVKQQAIADHETVIATITKLRRGCVATKPNAPIHRWPSCTQLSSLSNHA